MADLSTLETPRLLKKPGGLHKRVENQDELKAAVADGWKVKLEPVDLLPPEASPTESYAADTDESFDAKKGGKKK